MDVYRFMCSQSLDTAIQTIYEKGIAEYKEAGFDVEKLSTLIKNLGRHIANNSDLPRQDLQDFINLETLVIQTYVFASVHFRHSSTKRGV